MAQGKGSTSQALENDPVNKDSPLEGAVHQAQEPWELHWGQITKGSIGLGLAQVKLGHKGPAHKLRNLCVKPLVQGQAYKMLSNGVAISIRGTTEIPHPE